jgi:ribonuclease HI
MPRFGPEQRLCDPIIIRGITDEYVKLDPAHWLKIAKRTLKKVQGLIKNGAKDKGQKRKLNLPEYQDIAVKLIALQQSATTKQTHTKTKLKRTENALWEELNRSQNRETIRVATDGSHTKGQVAGWGAAIWEEGSPVTDLFGPVILGATDLNPYSFGANCYSNNTGEVHAACEGFLEIMHRAPNSVAWIYDSELTCSVATGKSFISGETAICDNLRKLFLKVSERAKTFGGLRCEHVYSHFGHTENEVADVLADKGVTERCATGRFLPGYQGMSQDIDFLNDVVNPPQPELDLVKTWSVMTKAFQET